MHEVVNDMIRASFDSNSIWLLLESQSDVSMVTIHDPEIDERFTDAPLPPDQRGAKQGDRHSSSTSIGWRSCTKG